MRYTNPMRGILRTLLIAAVAAVFTGGILAHSASGVTVPASGQTTTTSQIRVAIPIPGVTEPCGTAETALQTGGGNRGNCVEDLGTYIAGFYRYFSGVIGLLATVIVMWGGIKWITAGGNASRVSDAKDTIYSALIAILLTLGSFVLLRAINPQLLDLSLPSIADVRSIELGGRCEDMVGYSISPIVDCGLATASNASGNRVQCLWDSCSNQSQLCAPPATVTQVGPSTYSCQEVLHLCESLDNDNALPAWCQRVDQLMQQVTQGSAPKFDVLGCGFNQVQAGGDECVLGMLFSTMQNNPIYHERFEDGYEPKFYDCFTQEAENVCWEWHDEDARDFKVPKDCGGQTLCANLGASPRPVSGADGGCIRRISDGSFKCWEVPKIRPIGQY